MNLIFLQEQNSNSKVIESKNLSNDTIFKKYNVFEKDIIRIKENEVALLIDEGKLLDLKERKGEYIVYSNIGINEELKEITIRNSEKEKLCVIFINTNTIKNNKYIINNSIRYIEKDDSKLKKVYIKIEGRYDFKIVDSKKFISHVIGIRNIFTKQELIEKVRKYVLKSIEEGINEMLEEYNLDIEDLPENSQKLELKLKENQYDTKLLEYGVKLLYFDIGHIEIADKKMKFF